MTSCRDNSKRLWLAGPARFLLGAMAFCPSAMFLESSWVFGAPTEIPVISEWRMMTARDGLPDDSIRSIAIIQDEVWIGTNNGLAFLYDAFGTQWNVIDVPRSPVVGIVSDPVSHDVWIGTAGRGLFRFTAGRLDHFHQLNSGLSGDVVFSVAVHGGRVWAATNGGLSEYDPITETWNLRWARCADVGQAFAESVLLVDDRLYAVVSEDRSAEPLASGPWRLRPISDGSPEPMLPWSAEPRDIAVPPLVASHGSRVCAVNRNRPPIYCASSLSDEIPWHRLDPVESAGATEIGALVAGDMLVAADPQRIRIFGDDGFQLVYSSATPGGAVRVCRTQVGANEECRELQGRWHDGRIRCIATGSGHLWVGTTHGLLHGLNPVPWSTLSGLSRSDRAPVFEGIESVTKTGQSSVTPRKYGPRAIGVFGPGRRGIALPGLPPVAPGRGHRTDDEAIGYCVSLRAQAGGEPLDLVTASSGYVRYGWGLSEDDIFELAADARVEGIIGNASGTPWVTAATIQATEVPWMHVAGPLADEPVGGRWIFRCLGDEPRQHRILFGTIVDRVRPRRIAVLRDLSGSADVRSNWWAELATTRGLTVATYDWFAENNKARSDALTALSRFDPDALFIWADGKTSARTVSAARASGLTALVIGGPELLEPEFLAEVTAEIGPAVALLPRDISLDSDARRLFEANYGGWRAKVVKSPPSPSLTFRSFLACDHLLGAMDSAFGRENTRDKLVDLETHVNGEAHFESRYPGGCASMVWINRDCCDIEEVCPDH